VLSLIYPRHNSPGHAKSSQSSLVVYWQRIYNTLTVTTAHIKSSFRRLTPLYFVIHFQFSFSFFHNCRLRNSIFLYPLCADPTENSLYCWQSLFTAPLPSNRSPIVPCVCFCGNVFSDPLPSNGNGVDCIENNSCDTLSTVTCAYFGRCL
jgi:hypothetical protein